MRRALLPVLFAALACGLPSGPEDAGSADASVPEPAFPPEVTAPEAVDLGTFDGAPCPTATREVCFENVGAHEARLDAVSVTGDTAFDLAAAAQLPALFDAGASLCVTVRFASAAPGGAHAAVLEARLFGRDAPLRVALAAADAYDYRRLDVFHQPDPPRGDVLFVLDDAPATRALALEENLHFLAEPWSQGSLPLRVAVTTTALADDGALLPLGAPAVLDVHQDGFLEAFDALVAGRPIRDDTPDEGLAALARALEVHPELGRDGTQLDVVVVSASDDASATSTDAAVELVSGLGPRGPLVPFAAVVGPLRDGCDTGGASPVHVPPAPRYLEVADRTFGTSESACAADWARSLLPLEYPTVPSFRFSLRDPARPDSLRIEIETAEGRTYEASEWRYDPASGLLVLDGLTVPTYGATVRVAYLLACPAP